MNRKMLIFTALLGFVLAVHAIAEAPPNFCVRVFVTDRNGEHSMGSGTLLTPELVVTNWHVVKDAKRDTPVKVLFPDWNTKIGKIIKVNKLWDIAAIAIQRTDVKPAIIGTVPKKNDSLTVHGYGIGIPASSTGKLEGFVAPSRTGPTDIIEIKGARVRQGDSGGPILNDKKEYVGTLFGGRSNYTMGTHVGRVKIILGSLLKQKQWFEYNLTSTSQ